MVRQSSQGCDVLLRDAQRTGDRLGVRRSVSNDRGRLRLGLASGRLPLSVAFLGLAAALADGGHVGAVCCDGGTALLSCARRFFGIEAVCSAVSMSGTASLRAHGPQRVRVHDGESSTLFGAGCGGFNGGGDGLGW